MSTAEKITTTITPAITETLTWAEICRRYPDEYVCIVEIDDTHPFGSELRTSRVVGHGKTRREAVDQAKPWWDHYKVIGFYFTGQFARRILRRPIRVEILHEA